MRYRRKPKLAHAFRWQDQPEIPAWLADAISADKAYRYAPAGRDPQLMVRTPKGVLACHKGSWVVRWDDASLATFEHDEFAASFDLAANVVDWHEVAKQQAERIQRLELDLVEARNDVDRWRSMAP